MYGSGLLMYENLSLLHVGGFELVSINYLGIALEGRRRDF